MTEQRRPGPSRGKIMRIGAIAGALLALVCNALPHEYQTACSAVAQITAISCGG